jgi:hypothetical protein
VSLASSGGRGVWQRQEREKGKKRRKALAAKGAQEGKRRTAAPLPALEQAQAEKEAQGEVASDCPGYWGAQATFSVGTVKGGGRI